MIYQNAQYRVATNEDMPNVRLLASVGSQMLFVRDLRDGTDRSLYEVIMGPFALRAEDGFHVLVGVDRNALGPAKLRIVRKEGVDFLQVINQHYNAWEKSPYLRSLIVPSSL